jgi:TonB family protein
MTSLGGQNYAPFEVDRPEPKRRSYGAFIWAALALLVVGGIVIGILSVRRVLNKQNEAVATSSPEPLLAQNTSSPPDNSQVPTTTTSTATAPETNRSNVNANQSETKTSSPQPEAKVIFSPAPPAPGRAEPLAPPPANNQTSETKQPEAIDYNRVFAQREVDVKPQLLERPKPSYTDSARQNNVQGKVVLRVVLSANGSVGSISAISGLSHGLTEKAIAAARRIKFVPAQKDGRPVSVSVTVEYNFSVY